MISIAIKVVFLSFIILVCYLLYKIPFINRLLRGMWKKHWEIIIAVLAALFVGYFIMPKLIG